MTETSDFSYTYSDNLPAILKHLNISLAFTSYQAGRLMLVRTDGQELEINFKEFPRPMGLTSTDQGLILGTYTQIIQFQREDGLVPRLKMPLPDIRNDITAPRLHKNDEEKEAAAEARAADEDYQKKLAPADPRVDACFIARSAHYTGMINIHDIEWGNRGLWAVNSSFSCLCTIDPAYSFVPHWKPSFIDELLPEDRCHLNGMTLKDGEPAYVTTFSQYEDRQQWRQSDKRTGTLIDVQRNEIVVDGLAMPHSPRWHNGKVYFCHSGEGQLNCYHPDTGEHEVIAELPGFTRGIDIYGSIMFVGLSRKRESDVTSPGLVKEDPEKTCSGIWLFNLETHEVIGQIKFHGNVDQIYDIAILYNTSFPEVIEPSHPRMRNHFSHPGLPT
ncbi:MAG: TIGR03032 family protein [Thalassolituus sp.]